MSEQMSLEHALDRSKMDPSLDGSMASGAMGSAAGAAASLFRLQKEIVKIDYTCTKIKLEFVKLL